MDTKQAKAFMIAEKKRHEAELEQVAVLNRRHALHGGETARLKAALDAAEQNKAAALAGFAVGGIDAAAMTKARTDHETAEKKYADALELLTAMEAARVSNIAQPGCLREAEKALAMAVFEELTAECRAFAADRLNRAQTALCLAGRGGIWKEHLYNLFGELRGSDAAAAADSMRRELFS